MTLNQIAQLCWNNRATIPFGNEASWSVNIFLKAWFKINAPELWVIGSDAPGWYWFEANTPLVDLKALAKPANLPKSACDFGNVSRSNVALFDGEICQEKSNITVVYNGQDANVLGRIRAHFSGNIGNGAIGIKYYALSKNHWSVSLFHRDMLEKMSGLSTEEKTHISDFCNSHTGRIAVEGAWRSIYGWPVLCKA
jgi:hypothetical protein